MSINLKQAQRHLTEQRMRMFWSHLTDQYQTICTHSGLSLDWKQPLSMLQVKQMVQDLLKCHTVIVACPVYMYDYDAKADPPHHVTALTLIKCQEKGIFLSYFNAKGKKSPRLAQETQWLNLMAQQLQQHFGLPVKVQMYTGRNIQDQDYIGLCQLYSMFYLCQFIEKVHHVMTTSRLCQTLSMISNPNTFVTTLKKYNETGLKQFYQLYFTSCNEFWCER